VDVGTLERRPGISPVLQHPLSRGTVHINTSDPIGEPVVDFRAFANPIDLQVSIEILRFVRRYMASEKLAPYQPIEIGPGVSIKTDEQIVDWLKSVYIPSV
jgi:choline dehydrogenase-like flavoprotein